MWFERLFATIDAFRARRLEQRLREELTHHLAARTEEYEAAGLQHDEARHEAARRLGDPDRALRDGLRVLIPDRTRLRSWLIGLDHDLRDARRAFTRRFGNAISAASIVAIAAAGSATAWSITDATVLRPLPFPDADRLVRLGERHEDMPESVVASFRSYVTWRNHARTLAGVAATRPQEFNLEQTGEPQRVSGAQVSGNYFAVMGVAPVLGRALTPEDDRPGATSVVVISKGLWTRAFGADPGILGRSVRLDGIPRTVVGIAPSLEPLPSLGWDEIFVPLALNESEAVSSHSRWLLVIGRLAPAQSLDTARGEIDALQERLRSEWPDGHGEWSSTTRLLHEWLTGRTWPITRMLMAMAVLVLGACAFSFLSLALADATDRRREIGMRVALGAAPSRLLRLAAVEGFLLGTIGGGIGLGVAALAVDLLPSSSIAIQIPRLAAVRLPWAPAALLLAAAVLAAMLLRVVATVITIGRAQGLLSGLQAREASLPRRVRVAQRGLATAQLGFALFVMTAAAALTQSFHAARGVNPGFSSHGVVSMQLSLPATRYRDAEARRLFVRHVLAELKSLPEVAHAGAAQHLPLGLTRGRTGIVVSGHGDVDGHEPLVQHNVVGGGYFDALGIRLIAGRRFSDHEEWAPDSTAVIVNHALARRFFNGDALGRALRVVGESVPRQVVGVVDDVKRETLETNADPELFLPFSSQPSETLSVVTRATHSASVATSLMQNAVRRIDPLLPVSRVITQEQALARALAPRQSQAIGVTTLAIVSTTLAVLGLYGLLARAVATRVREFGIRLAVGARRADLLAMVVRETLAIVAVAIVIGMLLLAAARPILAAVLYRSTLFNLWTFGLSIAMLVSMALLAAFVPARRAATTDTSTLLRREG